MNAERSSDSRTPCDKIDEFISAFTASLADGSFSRLTLGCWRGTGTDIRSVSARIVEIKRTRLVSMVAHHRTKDLTRNVAPGECPDIVRDWFRQGFRAARLFTARGDLQADWNKRTGYRLTRLPPAGAAAPPSTGHDRVKRRLVPVSAPFLKELGVTDAGGRVLPSMSHKWKQINRFVEILDGAVSGSGQLTTRAHLAVADFGSGKGYLTFAAHHHLQTALGKDVAVTGIERRADLVAFCNRAAEKLGLNGIEFREGDLHSHAFRRLDILVALHACDTATDEAIAMGIRAGAQVIVCAPCCHKEIRPQLTPPAVLRPVLRFGVHAAQEAEMVTDTIRALLMEAHGYGTQVFEFISTEHTDKNRMILGVLRGGANAPQGAAGELAALKSFYGIAEHRLEKILRSGV